MEPVEVGDYGIVIIAEGEHEGITGYYDDDESEEVAIVYIGATLFSDVIFVSHQVLKKAPDNIFFLAHKRFLRKYPEAEYYFGITE